jgi:hypothetical protein
VLNTAEGKRKGIPEYLQAFPFVNGGLFEKGYRAPLFSRRSRQLLIDSGELIWADINPDIFGSMFQAVISEDQRGNLGQHYTSVPNIMKVIEPLFLNELYEAFEKAKGNDKKLNELLYRLRTIKIFDPACGSGNFLIIAYKELRRLEMKIFKESGVMPLSGIALTQFYGIELDDFAHEIAKLALWLAEHQMNVESFKEFGKTNPTLPLKEAGHIVQGNATRLDWEVVCPKNEDDEIYILGNPPYLGDKIQSKEQKEELKELFKSIKNSKAVDYIGAWFIKASNYISGRCEFAFVTTNSINQGVQVPIIWPYIFNRNLQIGFAHKSFVWSNNAKQKAGVICSIVGVRITSNRKKLLFEKGTKKIAKNINAYLLDAQNIIIEKHSSSISNLPLMTNGNIPRDQGNFMLSQLDKDELQDNYPEVRSSLLRIVGSKEYLNDIYRWCLWIDDNKIDNIKEIPPIKARIEKVKIYRINGSERGKLGIETPYKFERTLQCKDSQLIIPRVSSGRREYIPIGFLDNSVIVSDAALVVFDPVPHLMGIISSKMHMVWLQTTAGRLKADYRYSVGVCYNSFPFPTISKQRKEELTHSTFRILEERERHSGKTLAQLYDPDKMPDGLREAHRLNDLAVERCYRVTPFTSDEERLEYLFKLYEKMIQEEKDQATLFAKEKKTRKKKK